MILTLLAALATGVLVFLYAVAELGSWPEGR
jgi:hypothetical protein